MRLLDLFCGAGGCSVGYHRAGFTPEGADLNRAALRRYPFMGWEADAMTLLADPDYLAGFDAVHASPPCQAYSVTRHTHDNKHPDLLAQTYELLQAWGGPWVIENVPGAVIPDATPVVMCGAQSKAADDYIGQTVRLRRHRLFWSNVPLMAEPCSCDGTRVGGVYGGAWSKNATTDPSVKRTGGYAPPDSVQRQLMGIDWMTRGQLAQAIPPAYTEHIGWQLMEAVA